MTNKIRSSSGILLIKNSFLNLLGMSLPLIVGVISIPFAIKGLGIEAFGILSIIWVILSYLSLLDFGLSKANTKFTSEKLKKNEIDDIPPIFWTSMTLSFCLGTLSAIILYFITPVLVKSLLKIPVIYINDTIRAFRLIAVILPIILLSISLKGMLGAAQRFDLVNIVQIPVNASNFLFPALSLPFGIKLSTVILMIVFSRIIAFGVYLYFCIRIYPYYKKRIKFDLLILKTLLSYGGWITITSVISPILVYLDRIFIGSLLTMNALTYYSAPLEAITRLRVIPMAIMITLFPEFSIGLSHESKDRLGLLFNKSLKMILLSTGFLVILSFSFAKDILTFWLGELFAQESTIILQIFSVSVFFNFIARVPFTFLQGIGRPDLPAKYHMIEFPLYILVLWFLTIHFGIQGAAFAWLCRVTLDAVLLFKGSLQYLSNVKYFYKTSQIRPLLITLFIFGMFSVIVSYINIGFILQLILTFVCLTLCLWFVWHYVIDSSEKKLIYQFIGSIIFYKKELAN